MNRWIVSGKDEVKLLDFIHLKLKESCSKREIKGEIEANCCQVNGQMERMASRQLLPGDKVQFNAQGLGKESAKPEFSLKRVLFEDPYILVYNKPSGVSSDATGILNHLKPYGKALFLVHRLDKETSGVLILAKSQSVQQTFEEAFRQREIKKEYLALVDGIPKQTKGSIQNYLGKVGSHAGQPLYGEVPINKGKLAKTDWRLALKGKKLALLHCYPETGRTHQIRAHLSGMGLPILGDYHYEKKFKGDLRPARLMLHAYRVAFLHPDTKDKIVIEAPIPKDFQEMMEKLR